MSNLWDDIEGVHLVHVSVCQTLPGREAAPQSCSGRSGPSLLAQQGAVGSQLSMAAPGLKGRLYALAGHPTCSAHPPQSCLFKFLCIIVHPALECARMCIPASLFYDTHGHGVPHLSRAFVRAHRLRLDSRATSCHPCSVAEQRRSTALCSAFVSSPRSRLPSAAAPAQPCSTAAMSPCRRRANISPAMAALSLHMIQVLGYRSSLCVALRCH